MTDSPNLALPYIDGGEAQPFVTHNDAVRALDALAQLAVLDRDLAAPPGSPADGQRWIVAASPTGAWTGHATQVAAWQDGAWEFYMPRTGWFAYVLDEGTLLAFNGTAWVDAMAILTALQNLALLGVGTTADSTNPFSAKLNGALWTAKAVAEGGDGNLRTTMSKESAAKTVSLLLQDNYSGRAEIGLTGDDDFHFKVSPDGSAWTDALVIDRTTGALKVAGDVAIATNKFTVASASGNATVAGTLSVAGNLAINTTKFTVAASSGNTAVAGTLGVAGATAITNGTASTSTSTGALVVTGGAGIGGALYVGADASLAGRIMLNGAANGAQIDAQYDSSLRAAIILTATDGSTAGELMVFKKNGGTTAGSITWGASQNSVNYNTTSDRNRKTDARKFTRSRQIIDASEIWDFAWKGSGGRGIGVFAQDAYRVFPDAITPSDLKGGWQADYSKYVPVLIADAQETHARLARIEHQIGAAARD